MLTRQKLSFSTHHFSVPKMDASLTITTTETTCQIAKGTKSHPQEDLLFRCYGTIREAIHNLLSLHSGNIRISSYRVAFPMPLAACNCCPINPSPDRNTSKSSTLPTTGKKAPAFRRMSGYPQSHGTFWKCFFFCNKQVLTNSTNIVFHVF